MEGPFRGGFVNEREFWYVTICLMSADRVMGAQMMDRF